MTFLRWSRREKKLNYFFSSFANSLFHVALAYAAACLPCKLKVEVPFGEMLNSLHSFPCALGSQALSHGPLSSDTGEHFQRLTARDYKIL